MIIKKKGGLFVYWFIVMGFLFLFFGREPRMKLRVCTKSLWSHFKVTQHLVRSLLFEEELSIPMIKWRLIPKVSFIGKKVYIFFHYYYDRFSMFILVLFKTMDTWIVFLLLWGHINKSMGLFIHSRMAGEKSKDGVSVPKKGSR